MTDAELHRKFLDWIYPAPDGTDYSARYFHADLEEMSELTLRGELFRVDLRMHLDPTPSSWLLERYDRIKERL